MHFKVHFRCLSTIFRTTWQRPDNAIKYTVRALVAHRMVHKLINVFYGVVATKHNNNARVWGKGKRRGPFPKFGRSHLQRGVTLHTCIRCPPVFGPFWLMCRAEKRRTRAGVVGSGNLAMHGNWVKNVPPPLLLLH